MTTTEALRYTETNGLLLVCMRRGYGYALYAESFDAFDGAEKIHLRDAFGKYETRYQRRLGGYGGEVPEEIEDEAVMREPQNDAVSHAATNQQP